jgi:hypothetical protein
MMVLLIQCLPPLRESDLNILMKIISYSSQEEYMINNGKHKNKKYAIVRLRHANDGFLRPSMTSRVLQLSFPKPTIASSLVTMPPDTRKCMIFVALVSCAVLGRNIGQEVGTALVWRGHCAWTLC